MVVHAQTARSGPYETDGAVTVFDRQFLALDADHVRVFLIEGGIESEVVAGISHTGIGAQTGTVVFSTPPDAGQMVVIERTVPLLQASDYASQGRVSPETIESDIDLATMRDQDLDREIQLAPRLPRGLGSRPYMPAPEAGRILVATADGWTNGLTEGQIEAARSYAERAEAAMALALQPAGEIGDLATIAGLLYRYTGENVIPDIPGWVPVGPPQPQHFGAVGDGITDDRAAIQLAYDSLAGKGGKVVFPTGTYLLGAVGDDPGDGAAIILGPEHSYIETVTDGHAVIVAFSNRVELFAQNGAGALSFSGLRFTNPEGPLQNQPKGMWGNQPGENTGYTGNCAIRQRRGAGLTVTRCVFRDFLLPVHYVGDADDNDIAVGHFEFSNNHLFGCAFPLVDSPSTVLMSGNVARDQIDAELEAGSDPPRDPGHSIIYLTDRGGAPPLSVVVTNNIAVNGRSSPIKIRKGLSVTVTGNVSHMCGRGIEVANSYGAAIDGNHIVLGPNSDDTQQSGILITDCGAGTIVGSGNIVDVNGQNAWGVKVEAVNDDEVWKSNGVTIGAMKVVDDVATSGGKSAIRIIDQAHVTIDGFQFIHTGLASKNYAIEVNNSIDVMVWHPVVRHILSAAADKDLIIRWLNASEGVARLSTDLLHHGPPRRDSFVSVSGDSNVRWSVDGITEIVDDGGSGPLLRLDNGYSVRSEGQW